MFSLPLLLFCCQAPKPIHIGFLGTLSGRFADLSATGHNGLVLALEECNRSGGVQGRPVVLLEEDDRADEAAAIAAFRRLVERGADAIVGPMISKTAIAIVPEANQMGVVVMGPTISTNALTGIDDHFFRVYTASEYTSRQLAREVHKLGAKRVLGLYDLTNRAHTESAYLPFQDEFIKLGGEVLPPLTFFAREQPSMTQLARTAVTLGADSVFVLMGSMDTALFSQCLRKEGVKLLLCCTDWSGTADVSQFGGRSIDGLIFLHSMNANANTAFIEAYRKRFVATPDFAALRTYEATWVLLQALRHRPDPTVLRDTLLEMRRFQVGETTIEFDRWGDVVRPHFPFQIVDGRMEALPDEP